MIIFEKIKDKIEEIKDEVVSIRRHIHQNPELSFEEYQTTNYIKQKLSEYGINYYPLKNTGVIGIIGKAKNSILLRADIDALPIQEMTGESYASKNYGIMHACGHDLHTAMLLGAGKIIKEFESQLKIRVLLLFQPGEELLPGGAKGVIDSGILDEFNVVSAFAQHINPFMETGKIAIKSGPLMASTDELYWTIKGRSCHAAQPNTGIDTIIPATAIVQSLQNMQYLNKNPIEPSIVSVTAINGGNVTNVFPDIVEMKGTLRCYTEEWRKTMHKILKEKSETICNLYGAECELEIRKGYPTLINNNEMYEMVKGIIINIYGKASLEEIGGVMWAEDFAYFSQKYPSCFWFLGAHKSGNHKSYPLHNPMFSPDEDSMKIGIALLSSIAMNYSIKQ